jgi:hypothetical protein
MKNQARLTVRLPWKLRRWLEDIKEEQGSSVNYEIIRSIRDRMDRTQIGGSPEEGATERTATVTN